MTEYVKDFDSWNVVKQNISGRQDWPNFRKSDIWWCSTGINVATETDGKNEPFERPVLIIHKFNNRLFWGVPMTTNLRGEQKFFHHDLTGYFGTKKEFEAKPQRLLLNQMRCFDATRLSREKRTGFIKRQELSKIQVKLQAFLK